MKRRHSMLDGPVGALNLTPLLDIIFNLIFFFVLATTIREQAEERQIEIRLPEARSGQAIQDRKPIPEITLKADGSVFFNGEAVDDSELETRLKRAVDQDQVREVLLASDGDATWQRIVTINDICRRVGITQVPSRIMDPAPREP
jgi:biopolymer transport protein ExbD